MTSSSYGRRIGGYVAATAGTTQTQAGATALTGYVNAVTTGNAGDGVRLPAGYERCDALYIVNLSAHPLNVYPPVGGALNGGTVDAAVEIDSNTAAACACLGSDNWGVVFTAYVAPPGP